MVIQRLESDGSVTKHFPSWHNCPTPPEKKMIPLKNWAHLSHITTGQPVSFHRTWLHQLTALKSGVLTLCMLYIRGLKGQVCGCPRATLEGSHSSGPWKLRILDSSRRRFPGSSVWYNPCSNGCASTPCTTQISQTLAWFFWWGELPEIKEVKWLAHGHPTGNGQRQATDFFFYFHIVPQKSYKLFYSPLVQQEENKTTASLSTLC